MVCGLQAEEQPCDKVHENVWCHSSSIPNRGQRSSCAWTILLALKTSIQMINHAFFFKLSISNNVKVFILGDIFIYCLNGAMFHFKKFIFRQMCQSILVLLQLVQVDSVHIFWFMCFYHSWLNISCKTVQPNVSVITFILNKWYMFYPSTLKHWSIHFSFYLTALKEINLLKNKHFKPIDLNCQKFFIVICNPVLWIST